MTDIQPEVTPEDSEPSYRGLKILVVSLGVAIIIMIGAIFYGLAHKAKLVFDQPDTGEAIEKNNQAGDSQYWAEMKVKRPEGSKLIRSDISGDFILLRFQKTDGSDLLVIIDRRTGKQTRLLVEP